MGSPQSPFTAARPFSSAWLMLCFIGLTCWNFGSLAHGDPTPPVTESAKPLAKVDNLWLRTFADSPIHWNTWSTEAFETARRENKPIFLMIGYPSCPGFRRMQRQVLNRPEVIQLLNSRFVPVLVDRDERPELSTLYLCALETYFRSIKSSQVAGWPVTLFLTPEGSPLGGGTYFAEDTAERAGALTVLKRIMNSWEGRRTDLIRIAEDLTKGTRREMQWQVPSAEGEEPKAADQDWRADHRGTLLTRLWGDVDAEQGGFQTGLEGGGKYPFPARILAMQELSSLSKQEPDPRLLNILDAYLNGALLDHLAGGFHHNCHEANWTIPAFEKRLTDNLQLAEAFTIAFQQTHRTRYRIAAEQALRFVLEELPATDGGFFASLGDETAKGDRLYYVWTREEIQEALTPEEFAVCRRYFGLNASPNYGKFYTLRQVQPLDDIARDLNLTAEQVELRWQQGRTKLLEIRQHRTPLVREEKILACDNGLAIRALTRCGLGLKHPEFIREAQRTAMFVLSQMRDERGRLRHVLQNGELAPLSFLEDHAAVIDGLLALHQATADEKWLNAAERLMGDQVGYFADDQQGGFFATPRDHEDLLFRFKPWREGTVPSGNSQSIRNMVRLAGLSHHPQWEQRAQSAADTFWPVVRDNPALGSNFILAIQELKTQLNSSESIRLTQGDRSRRVVTLAADKQPGDAEGGEQGSPTRKSRAADKPVTGMVYLAVDKLPAGAKTPFLVRLKIKEPWHINAHEPGNEFFVPTNVSLTSRLKTKLVKPQYPRGDKHQVKGIDEASYIYAETVDIRGFLDVPAEAAGKEEYFRIAVEYQACTDEQCLKKQTLELKLPVDVAAEGEPIKRVNAKLFPVRKPSDE